MRVISDLSDNNPDDPDHYMKFDEMGDDEFGRLIKQYLHGISDIDKDFTDSDQHSDKFSEDDLI